MGLGPKTGCLRSLGFWPKLAFLLILGFFGPYFVILEDSRPHGPNLKNLRSLGFRPELGSLRKLELLSSDLVLHGGSALGQILVP